MSRLSQIWGMIVCGLSEPSRSQSRICWPSSVVKPSIWNIAKLSKLVQNAIQVWYVCNGHSNLNGMGLLGFSLSKHKITVSTKY